MLSVAFIGTVNASTVTLTVNTDTDESTLYPGGQTDSSGATKGDLRYCINYILNEQAQGNVQDYEILFDVLKWNPPGESLGIVSYQISRNGVVIAVVPASDPSIYYDHNRKKNMTYIYTIVSQYANGAKSTPVSITLKS